MEIKATLQKPYEEKERLDFIVEQNHQNGYEIRETAEELEAWGYTDEEIAEKEKERRIEELKIQLAQLDSKSARSMRAILAETATAEDRTFLANLENQAEDLRQQIKDLQGA